MPAGPTAQGVRWAGHRFDGHRPAAAFRPAHLITGVDHQVGEGLVHPQPHPPPPGRVELLAGGLAAYVAAIGLKDLIGRGRPAQLVPDMVFHGAPAQGLGFPSGHAAVSAALAAVAVPFLARRWRRWVWVLPVTVGFARIFVGAHLPLDVLGGFLLGWTIGAAVHLAVGSPSGRVTPDQVRTALTRAGLLVAEVHPANVDARGSTPFFATGVDGTRWFAKAVGADQRDGDILFKAYRWIAFRDLDDERAFASAKRQPPPPSPTGDARANRRDRNHRALRVR